MRNITPLDEEILFSENEIIVSKTDIKGRILYANDVFCRVAEMATTDVIGEPHSIIRHPDMPRVIFKLLWDTLAAQREIFAYVKNMSASGRYYWVIAHVTATLDSAGKTIGYHSNRRKPTARAVKNIQKLYDKLSTVEAKHPSRKEGLIASSDLLNRILSDRGESYDKFVWSVGA